LFGDKPTDYLTEAELNILRRHHRENHVKRRQERREALERRYLPVPLVDRTMRVRLLVVLEVGVDDVDRVRDLYGEHLVGGADADIEDWKVLQLALQNAGFACYAADADSAEILYLAPASANRSPRAKPTRSSRRRP
jgi:hypothetical protein